jgi:hypothetical protein
MRFAIQTLAALAFAATPAHAEGPADFAAAFAAEARRVDPSFAGLSAERGERFFRATHGSDWSCATCHGAPPNVPGEHAVTGKRIAPLAPAANPERFTSTARVEKWFKRNCNDVLKRPCSAQEKGDVLTWLMSLPAKEMR